MNSFFSTQKNVSQMHILNNTNLRNFLSYYQLFVRPIFATLLDHDDYEHTFFNSKHQICILSKQITKIECETTHSVSDDHIFVLVVRFSIHRSFLMPVAYFPGDFLFFYLPSSVLFCTVSIINILEFPHSLCVYV